MAWDRKKSGGRREPKFGLAASLAGLRLSPQDRITVGDSRSKKPGKSSDADASRERKPAARSSKKSKTGNSGRGLVYRMAYWGAVLGLWGAIATVGVVVWVAPADDQYRRRRRQRVGHAR